MKPVSKCLIIWLFVSSAAVTECRSQVSAYTAIVNSIAGQIAKVSGHEWAVSGIDVGKAAADSDTRIRDPYHTLVDCFIFLAADVSEPISNRFKGFVGIYRIKTDSVIWRSVPLSYSFSSGALGSVERTDELNRDGKVEIVIGQGKEPVGTGQLWIFNWNGSKGELVAQLDRNGESVIMYSGDEYEVKDTDGDGIYEVQTMWYKNSSSSQESEVTYAWNGTAYGKWGKSSKNLLKGMKK